MLLMKIRKNSGPEIDSCGTALGTNNHLDTFPFKTTCCCQLSVRHTPCVYLAIIPIHMADDNHNLNLNIVEVVIVDQQVGRVQYAVCTRPAMLNYAGGGYTTPATAAAAAAPVCN